MDCIGLKVGDKVWTGDRWQERRAVKKVTRCTPTMVVLDDEPKYGRFYKNAGYRVGGDSWDSQRITAKATRKECSEWDAAQKAKRLAAEEKQRQAAALELKRSELRSSFDWNVEFVDVGPEKWNDRASGLWQIEIHNLTEDHVRIMAKALTGLLR